jgi:hypothetical protein
MGDPFPSPSLQSCSIFALPLSTALVASKDLHVNNSRCWNPGRMKSRAERCVERGTSEGHSRRGLTCKPSPSAVQVAGPFEQFLGGFEIQDPVLRDAGGQSRRQSRSHWEVVKQAVGLQHQTWRPAPKALPWAGMNDAVGVCTWEPEFSRCAGGRPEVDRHGP